MIVRGELEQGKVISIMALTSQLDIGRTPLTIACQKLEIDGFVKIIPKQGLLINHLTIDDAREMYELRMAIETFSAKRVFEQLTEVDIARFKESVQKQAAFVSEHDVYNFLREDTEMHLMLLKKYNNNMFINVFNNLLDRVFLFGLKVCSSQSRLDGCIVEHNDIIKYLESGEKDKFIAALELNIMNGYIQLTGSYKLD
jgi:DNA-binding GntR family transcriptional regulator